MNTDFPPELDEVVGRVNAEVRPFVQQDIDRLRDHHVQSRQDLRALASDATAASAERETAIWALGRIRDSDATSILVGALAAEDSTLRAAAARALGELGAESVSARLSALLRSDPKIEPRRAAAYSLGLIGHATAIPDLIAVLQDSGEPPALRGMVAEALADIGDPDAVNALTDALSDNSPEVRFWALHALGRLGTCDLLEQLHRLTTDSASVPGFGTVAEECRRTIAAIREREAHQPRRTRKDR